MLAAGCSQQNTEQEGNSTNQEQTKDKDKKEKTTEIPTEEWGVIAIPERVLLCELQRCCKCIERTSRKCGCVRNFI